MKVKAIRMGYYGIKRRRPGAVFRLKDPKDFSEAWMVKLEDAAPAVVVEPEEPEMEEEEFDEEEEVI